MSCSYDCFSKRKEIEVYSDISGLGVTFGFIATAYITVIVVVSYYLVGFDPQLDVFRKDGAVWPATKGNNPNPVDSLILGFVHRLRKPNVVKSQASSSWSEALNKSVLIMSDLQLMTGLAILISGYVTLQCGLSDYHWQIIVYLAWFSSISQLAAMTFLRNYLFNHQAKRFTRIILMVVFGLMLIIAIIPTGIFDEIDALSYAVCGYKRLPEKDSPARDSMIVTILLYMFSFGTRLIKLHKQSSDWVNVSFRRRLSGFYRDAVLNPISKWVYPNQNPDYWRRTVVYLPALTIFLICRLQFDLYSSMISEVYWLIISTIWGTIKLYQTRGAVDTVDENGLSFGQITPVVLLIVPLFAIVEQLHSVVEQRTQYKSANLSLASEEDLNHASQEDNTALNTGLPTEDVADSLAADRAIAMECSDSIQQVRSYHVRNNYQCAIDDPDGEYFANATWMGFFLVLELLFILTFTTLLLIFIGYGRNAVTIFALSLTWLILIPPYTLSLFTLLAFMIDRNLLHSGRWIGALCAICSLFVAFSVFMNSGMFIRFKINSIHGYIIGGSATIYILLCLLISWRKGD